MAGLSTYEELDFYDKRLDLTGQDFVIGFTKEFWVGPLAFGETRPEIKTISCEAAALLDATTIEVSSDVADTRIYRGDVLKFGNVLVVVSATTVVGTASTDLPVLPLSAALTGSEAAATYALFPVWSLMDGGDLEFSGTEATARNKIQGLYPAKRVVERDGTINVSGSLYVDDPGANFMEKLAEGNRNLYYEIRWAPYQQFTGDDGVVITQGSGPGARVGVATVQQFNIPSSRSEFAQINGTLGIASRPVPYTPLVVA